jgi:hypothetical protein
MKVAHFICKRTQNGRLRNLEIVSKESGLWRSGNWDVSEGEAAKLIGGRIFLHETKAQPSAFGGEVIGFEAIRDTTVARERRIVFTIRPSASDKGVAWRGRADAMASYGGILDV